VELATKDLLRLATIGSVDDGKSTLIGRLLVDTRQLFDDQLDAVAAASEKRGIGDLDLSFVTDGLRAEREQGITIDVAYRYATSGTRGTWRPVPRPPTWLSSSLMWLPV
jgi:sulfate adenylyltransferase subunit 1 (EFTu-like GTPase family)